ncbi:hypothetical protein [Marinobacter metalliresistant]|uniref:hypothetical protein n=1 Tax=Marinobacter metalliresistant TaxID=2961995 RepID=UPI0035E3FDD8
MSDCWWILADGSFRFRLAGLAAAFTLTFPSPSYSIERVFEVKERSVAEILSPETLPIGFYTFEPDEYWAEPRDSYWLKFSNWVLRQERVQGPRIQSLGQWADRTLSGSNYDLPNNESYLRIGFATESEYGDPAQFKPEARFRLDIPTTRQKLRLVIESESEELIPFAERQRYRQLTEADRSDTEATGALRYLTEVGDAINFSNDLGVRLRIPADAFWRATAKKRWRLDDKWVLNAQQRFYYFHQDGWGERTWIDAGRPVGKGWHFRSSSELEWVHRDREFVAAQIFSLQKRTNNRLVVTPRLGVLGESQPSWRTTSVFGDLTFRYPLHSNWLYAELIPALEFPREASSKDRASVIFRVEMFFSGIIEGDRL